MDHPNAIIRAAEAMLRALGGAEIQLRCPTAAAKDQQARQLGLESPITDDIAIAPVVLRVSGESVEMLMPPSSIARYIQDRGQSAEQFFASVICILHGGQELHITSFASEQFAGAAYLYRVTATAKA